MNTAPTIPLYLDDVQIIVEALQLYARSGLLWDRDAAELASNLKYRAKLARELAQIEQAS